jgi:hypothetical protein
MKTAIQIAIENVDQCLNAEDIKAMLEGLLELEKQQMCNFAFNYQDEFFNNGKVPPIEQYYNQYYIHDTTHS